MGLYNQCLINFGVQVTPNNRSIDFRTVSMGPEKQATLRVGLYSLTSLANEIRRAMSVADPSFTYTVTFNRAVSAGTQNRITISTSGGYLDLLLLTGTRSASSFAPLVGYSSTDKTGATSYTGQSSCGTILIPSYPPQDYQPIGSIHDSRRSSNDSTSGKIETVSFSYFRNFQFKIKWIEEGSTEYFNFQNFNIWMLRGGLIEFSESVNDANTYTVGAPINVRPPIELNRMVPGFYDYFETPVYTFREVI